MAKARIVMLTEDERVTRLLERSVDLDTTDIITVSSPTSLMVGMAQDDTSAVVVDLANRAVNGEALWNLAGIAELHQLPLIIVSRQTRPEVMSLARVVGARDVISTGEPRQIIAGRMRLWMQQTYRAPLAASA